MSSRTAVIIGGGVIGLSTAYQLARRNFGRVVILEKDRVGDGSSLRAAGIITGLLWSEPGVRARQESLRLFRELSRDLDGYQFQAVGCLNVFDPRSWPEREVLLPLYQRLQVPFEVLSSNEMRRRWPALRPAENWTGLFDPLGGYSEPDEYVPALAKRCQSLGVEIREQQLVSGFEIREGRIAGVRCREGIIEADAVLCTTHAWTQAVISSLGLSYPVKNFVHQRYVTTALSTAVNIPAINANPLGGYIRPAAGGRLLLGIETAEREEWRVKDGRFHMSQLSAAPELKTELRHNFTPFLPALAETKWENERVGLIAFSMDGEPVLGPVADFPGLFVGCAFHSGGFAYNPVAGKLLAEYISDGQPSLDIRTFSPNRFAADQTREYVSCTLPQKSAVRRRH